MTTRRSFISSVALGGAAGMLRGAESTLPIAQASHWSYDGRKVRICNPLVGKPTRVWVIGDTHFGFSDSRDDAFAENYRRMAKVAPKKEPFEKMLAQAKKERPDLLLLVGDIISFPTLANVEYLKGQLDACGVPWLYVAGNHDWHFEGVPGSDRAQRLEWTQKRLAPLYQGANPLMASRVVNGVRFVAIDDSIYHIEKEQLEFWRQEAAKGDPIALMMHIPFWHRGWNVFTCGCPDWGAKTDPCWQIEQRERWADKQAAESFALREAVFATPNLVGVFTGHLHALQFAQEGNAPCFGVPSNRTGAFLDVSILGR